MRAQHTCIPHTLAHTPYLQCAALVDACVIIVYKAQAHTRIKVKMIRFFSFTTTVECKRQFVIVKRKIDSQLKWCFIYFIGKQCSLSIESPMCTRQY